jgi:hypothetical protein
MFLQTYESENLQDNFWAASINAIPSYSFKFYVSGKIFIRNLLFKSMQHFGNCQRVLQMIRRRRTQGTIIPACRQTGMLVSLVSKMYLLYLMGISYNNKKGSR